MPKQMKEMDKEYDVRKLYETYRPTMPKIEELKAMKPEEVSYVTYFLEHPEVLGAIDTMYLVSPWMIKHPGDSFEDSERPEGPNFEWRQDYIAWSERKNRPDRFRDFMLQLGILNERLEELSGQDAPEKTEELKELYGEAYYKAEAFLRCGESVDENADYMTPMERVEAKIVSGEISTEADKQQALFAARMSESLSYNLRALRGVMDAQSESSAKRATMAERTWTAKQEREIQNRRKREAYAREGAELIRFEAIYTSDRYQQKMAERDDLKNKLEEDLERENRIAKFRDEEIYREFYRIRRPDRLSYAACTGTDRPE